MDVSQIVNKIARLSLDERDPSVETQEDILLYLNAEYASLLTELSDLKNQVGRYHGTRTAALDANGEFELPNANVTVKRVLDVTNQNELIATDLPTILDDDPFDTDSGNASRFYLSGLDKVKMHPTQAAGGSYKVVYLENANELTMDTLESDVRFHPAFHVLLVWLTMPYIAIDERDKGSTSLITYYENKAQRVKDKLFDYLGRQPATTTYTETYG